MKIAIMSDSHDNWKMLEKAIEICNSQNCTYLLFAGDFMSPPGIEHFKKFKGNVKFVWGNNDGEKVGLTKLMLESKNVELCGDIMDEQIAGLKFFMNHYPEISRLAAQAGNYDVCVYGHNHIYNVEKVGNCLLINPGEIQGYKTGICSFVIFDSDSKSVDKLVL